ncbi:cysteine/O-acetylserine efflux protein [Eubacterium aggregans]|uniref:Cysteine/O-acetylserine efflux protein n=1 Tax=Eubacterium aggregans TaxID=81409 RepID=A0A1H4CDJ2_9FIRM|nr:LysE family transporter [Eubacterium aggregans]SEA58363.1 cysteine/O-acetylserine efflux protein [Eubacterium aggregans]
MLFSIIISYLPYTLVTAFTPGPNNIVAFYAISHGGWRRGKNTLLGIGLGFLCVMVLCALFCYELAQLIPSMVGMLKYIGAAYIVYLAIHVALSQPEDGGGEPVSFMKGFLLEFVNVKIILYAITVYTGYVMPYTTDLGILLIHSVVLTAIGVAGNLAWAAAGGLFQTFLTKHYRLFNGLMALVLLWCAVALAFNL